MQSVEAPRRRQIETENVLGFNIERKRGREGERESVGEIDVGVMIDEDEDDDDNNDDDDDDDNDDDDGAG